MINQHIIKLNILFITLFSFNNNLLAQNSSCLNFDGFVDRVTIPLQASQSLNTNDFTFEARINGLEQLNSNATILSNRFSTNSGFQLFIHDYWGGSDHHMLSFRYNTINWLFVNNGEYDGKLLDGNCHHIALSKVGSTISFYIDGVLLGKKENQPNIDISTSTPILIGNDSHSNNAFQGSINDVRIWNVGRSMSEINEGLYGEIDPNTEGLLGYWKMREGSDQTISDLTNQYNAVLGDLNDLESTDPLWGNSCCEIPDPVSTMCLGFDGINDQVSIPAEVGQTLGDGDFTFEAKINGLEDENVTGSILSNRVSTNSGIHMFIHTYWGGSSHKMLALRYNNINWVYINNGDFNGKILDGNCHHVAITKEEGTLSFYIDGVLIGAKENQPAIDINTNTPFLIGNDGFSNDAFKGVINDVRIWNIARSQSELQDGIYDGVDPDEEGLLGYWEMREGNDQTAHDLTNKYDATLGSQSDMESSDPTWGNDCCGVGIVTDVNDLDVDNYNFLIYPNPSNGIFTVETGDTFISKKYTYSLYDNMGRLIESKPLSASKLDFQNVFPGHYFLKISNATENLGVSKIVILK